MRNLPVGLRIVLLGSVTIAVVMGCWAVAGDGAARLARALAAGRLPAPDQTLDQLMSDLAATFALVATAGFAASVALSAASLLLHRHRRGRWWARHLDRVTPLLCRRLVAVCCGIGLAAPGAFGASADASGRPALPPCHAPCHRISEGLDGLPLPDLPLASGPVTGRPAVHHPVAHHQLATVVVRSGDSLWAIAERLLPGDADATDVAHLTDRLYRLNHTLIGPDRDLILPGMTLHVPKGTS